MQFQELVHALSTCMFEIHNPDNANPNLAQATCDSREVTAGDLFICKGAKFKPQFLEQALERGAAALLVQADTWPSLSALCGHVPVLIAPNTQELRRIMADASAALAQVNFENLSVIGVTGTKGKSTVTFMLREILGRDRAGIIGSIIWADGLGEAESLNTTPEAPEFWQHLCNAQVAGLSAMVCEVSSQALKYDRVRGAPFSIACFLNIGQDHLSPVEHPSFEDYFASKLRIFEGVNWAVVPGSGPYVERIRDAALQAGAHLVTFGANDPDCDVWASDIHASHTGVHFTAHTHSWKGPIFVSMPGLFSVDNALAAIAMASLAGATQEQCVQGLAHVHVTGRMELLQHGDVIGLVDYAHNRMSFEAVFTSVRAMFPEHAIVAMFGATGDKALDRRIELGEAVSKYADYVVLTEDDSGTEDPAEICAAIAHAMDASVPHEVVLPREKAVVAAVDKALELGKPVVVCLLGKGEETTIGRHGAYEPIMPDRLLFEAEMERRGL